MTAAWVYMGAGWPLTMKYEQEGIIFEMEAEVYTHLEMKNQKKKIWAPLVYMRDNHR